MVKVLDGLQKMAMFGSRQTIKERMLLVGMFSMEMVHIHLYIRSKNEEVKCKSIKNAN